MQILVKGLLSYIFSLKILIGWCYLSYSNPILLLLLFLLHYLL
jgi:hypothetical protein